MSFVVKGSRLNRKVIFMAFLALSAKGALANSKSGIPDRIEMRDAKSGEGVLLVNHVNLTHNVPYRASHAIIVREGAQKTCIGENETPAVRYARLLSLRAFNEEGVMVDALLARGDKTAYFYENEQTAFIHAHNARRGCYDGLMERLES